MKLLLHTCCAPCSSAIIETLLSEGVRPLIYYCNPNIYPYDEYLKRKDECSRYAAKCGLDMVDADYTHAVWLQCVSGLENEPERGARCTECFKHRLLSSAEYAWCHGYDTVATTLASSRWKNLDQINAAGDWAVKTVSDAAAKSAEFLGSDKEARKEPLIWWGRNWRKGGLQDRRNALLRENNFYNQTYCGCEFSINKESL